MHETPEEIIAWLRERRGEPEIDYLLRHGRSFEPRGLPDKRRRRWSKQADPLVACYQFAQQAAFDSDWQYVEGYATRRGDWEGAQGHAWNLAPDGALIDVTWDDEGVAYFGVVLPKEHVSPLVLSIGAYHPVLGILVEQGKLV